MISIAEIENDILSRIAPTVSKLTLIANDRGYGSMLPTNTLFILDILRKADLFYTDAQGAIKVNGLLMLVAQLQQQDPGLLRWLIRQARGSDALQVRYRNWLIEHGLPLYQLLPYFETTFSDRVDFSIGILLGCCDSLAVENIQGWFDTGSLLIDMGALLTEYEKERIQRFVKSFQNSYTNSSTSLAKAINDFKDQFSVPTSPVDIGAPIQSLIDLKEKIKTILQDAITRPLEEIMEQDKNDLNKLYTNLMLLVEQLDAAIPSVWDFAIQKFYTEIREKASAELLKHNYAKAGYIYGRAYTNLAQLLIGLAKLLWEGGKLVVKGGKFISGGLQKLGKQRYLLALLIISASSPGSRMVVLKAERAGILMVGKSRAEMESFKKGIQAILKEEVKHFQVGEVTAIEGNLAVELAQEKKVLLPAGCSSTGQEVNILIALSATLHVLLKGRRRKTGEAVNTIEKEPDEPVFDPDRWSEKYAPFSHHRIFEKIAKQTGIPYHIELDKKEIIRKYVEMMVGKFEKEIRGRGRRYKKKGIYTRFNHYISADLRQMLQEVEQEGGTLNLLIDERFAKRMDQYLEPGALVKFKGKSKTVQEIHNMTILEFYDFFFEEHKLSELYGKFADPLRIKEPELFNKWQYLREQLPLVKDKAAQEILFQEFEHTTEIMNQAIKKHKIDRQLSPEEIGTFLFGKLNQEGMCKKARPDFSLINDDGPDMTFDFVHRRIEGTDPEHFLGTSFYNDFKNVLYGEDYEAIVADISYTFSDEFMKILIE